jgi:DNA-binding CsgD family transcriptional regulator
VAQGARVVPNLDELQAELSEADDMTHGDRSWAAPGGSRAVPPRMEALVLLTASERRVLFYLTTGRSAQEIADDLVVSVTTVRSHIRSILRKLGVRSQLAAVAIANSRDFGCEDGGSATGANHQELATPGVG